MGTVLLLQAKLKAEVLEKKTLTVAEMSRVTHLVCKEGEIKRTLKLLLALAMPAPPAGPHVVHARRLTNRRTCAH